jgi:hypothetical protein
MEKLRHKKKTIKMWSKENLKEYMIKEVEIIQDTIKRMSFNSFIVKGWTVTLVVATLLLKGTEIQIFIAFVPLLIFWILDAYFLRQERIYRKLYDWVINNRLKTEEFLFDMNANRFKDEVQSIPRIMFSITLVLFYVPILVLVIIYVLVLFGKVCH